MNLSDMIAVKEMNREFRSKVVDALEALVELTADKTRTASHEAEAHVQRLRKMIDEENR